MKKGKTATPAKGATPKGKVTLPGKHTKAQPKRGRGRPTDFTIELGQRICAGISIHGTLTRALKEKGMPCIETVMRWLWIHEDFRKSYVHARTLGDEADAERMRLISTDPHISPEDKRIQVDVLKWQLARRNRNKWGESSRHELTGAEGQPLIPPAGVDASKLSDQALKELLAARQGTGEKDA